MITTILAILLILFMAYLVGMIVLGLMKGPTQGENSIGHIIVRIIIGGVILIIWGLRM